MRYDKKTEGCNIPIANFLWGRNVDNGWYVTVRLRWLTKVRKIMDPVYFDEYTERCYPIIQLKLRKPFWAKRFHLFKTFVWIPTNDWQMLTTNHGGDNGC